LVAAWLPLVSWLATTDRVILCIFEFFVAGGKELAILLIIVAGVWPYTKQAIALALWFLPPTVVSVTTRENAYLWLDALAKWSILDIFVLVMTLASFRISVQRYVYVLYS